MYGLCCLLSFSLNTLSAQTVRFKNEKERNITIKLGYANAKVNPIDDSNHFIVMYEHCGGCNLQLEALYSNLKLNHYCKLFWYRHFLNQNCQNNYSKYFMYNFRKEQLVPG